MKCGNVACLDHKRKQHWKEITELNKNIKKEKKMEKHAEYYELCAKLKKLYALENSLPERSMEKFIVSIDTREIERLLFAYKKKSPEHVPAWVDPDIDDAYAAAC